MNASEQTGYLMASAVGRMPVRGTATDNTAVGQLRQAIQLSVTCPAPVSKPSVVVAVYTFKLGLRRFSLRDEFIVKSGLIVRMRRSRS
eukprot:gene11930-12073_t